MFTSDSFYRGNCLTNFAKFVQYCVILELVARFYACITHTLLLFLFLYLFLDTVAHFYQTLCCSTALSPRQFFFEECKRTTHKFTQLWLMADACHCCVSVMVETEWGGWLRQLIEPDAWAGAFSMCRCTHLKSTHKKRFT